MRRVAEPLGLTLLEAASGIHRIANARMTRALRAVSSEKGRDPRDFALIAYGGAGPIHAAGLAEDLGMRTVLVPAVAGLFSAVGLLFARPEFHEVRTCHLDVDAVDPAVVAALFAEMEARLADALEGRSEVEWARTADLRYGGQSWEVEVGFPAGPIDTGVLAALRARFEDEHERLYGVKDRAGSPVEIRAAAPRGARRGGGDALLPARRRERAARRLEPADPRRRTTHWTCRCGRARPSARRRSRARCSWTSTTRPSSSRPAGRPGATRRPARSCWSEADGD